MLLLLILHHQVLLQIVTQISAKSIIPLIIRIPIPTHPHSSKTCICDVRVWGKVRAYMLRKSAFYFKRHLQYTSKMLLHFWQFEKQAKIYIFNVIYFWDIELDPFRLRSDLNHKMCITDRQEKPQFSRPVPRSRTASCIRLQLMQNLNIKFQ